MEQFLNKIILGDCLEVMKEIPDKSIDMILCDLPYGTTACEWDTVIPFEPLWEQYERIIKDNGAIVLFGMQPFTTDLIASNRKLYKYVWYWEKIKPSNHLNAKRQPLRIIEDIVVFYKKQTTYNPIMTKRENPIIGKDTGSQKTYGKTKGEYSKEYTHRYPVNLLRFPRDEQVHPTQKPVALCEYLIKTYTLPGEVVLDNCIGSGTTAIACINTGRNFIGIEIEEKYVKIARERIEKHKKLDKMKLFPISELETGKLQYKGLFEPEDEGEEE